VIIDPASLERRDLNALINGLVYPRPIAWVSTVGADGRRNLAPFSFFNAFCFHPQPVVGIGPGSRQGVNKDSLANIKESGEFVVSLVNEELAETANLTSAEFGPEVDEWDAADVEPAPSEVVRPERVAASPASFECRVKEIVELGTEEKQSNSLVIGVVERMHVSDDVLFDGYKVRPDAMRLVGRMGGSYWVRTRDHFELSRPNSSDPDAVRAEANPSR
jgi:flavin reductase (DIM6/NTAB) family NADH-FMN oxidoreductase RutF